MTVSAQLFSCSEHYKPSPFRPTQCPQLFFGHDGLILIEYQSIRWAAHVNASCEPHRPVNITAVVIIKLRRFGKVEDWDASRTHLGHAWSVIITLLVRLSTQLFLPIVETWQTMGPCRCFSWRPRYTTRLEFPGSDCLFDENELSRQDLADRNVWAVLACDYTVTWRCARRMSATFMVDSMSPPLATHSIGAAFRPAVDESSCRERHSTSVEGLHHRCIRTEFETHGWQLVALTWSLRKTSACKKRQA